MLGCAHIKHVSEPGSPGIPLRRKDLPQAGSEDWKSCRVGWEVRYRGGLSRERGVEVRRRYNSVKIDDDGRGCSGESRLEFWWDAGRCKCVMDENVRESGLR